MSRIRILALLAAAAFAAGCENDPADPVDPGPDYPPQGAVVSGDLQQGTVGQGLPAPLVVRVTDQDGEPIAGVNVGWTVTAGGGTLFAATSQTGTSGEAGNQWTLGTVAGDTQRVEARMVDPESGQPVVLGVFRAVGRPGAPATLTARPPAARAGAAGQALADSLEALVLDAHGNPVPGTAVAWSVSGGGGTIAPATTTTGADGIARAGWTLGLQLGPQTAEASLTPAVRAQFTATAGLPLGAALVRVSGDGQTGTVGSALAQPAVVELRTTLGQPVAGAVVTWTPIPGSGTATPTASTTGADGRASTTWTLGTAAGPQQLTASTDGVAAVVFGATAAPGAAASVTVVAGNGQTAPPHAPLPQPLAVRVTDAFGNPLAGVAVAWEVTAGGGGIAPASAQTDAAGQAAAQWTLGPAEGVQTARARVPGITPAGFTATAQVGPAAAIVVTPDSVGFASLGQTAQLTARAVDAYGNTVPGVTLTWTTLDAAVATVNGTGLVTAAGNGATVIRASGAGVVGQAKATVQQVPATVTVTLGQAALVQFDTTRATATVRDARGNAIAGTPVTWSSSSPAVATVNAAGLVTAAGGGTATITATTANGRSGGAAVTVSAALAVDSLVVGSRHRCVLTPAGTAYCWASNVSYQLAYKGSNYSATLRQIPGLTFASLTAGDTWSAADQWQSHTCGIEPDGDAYCWGNNESGQLGYEDGRTFDRSTVQLCSVGSSYTFICSEVPHLVEGGQKWRQLDGGSNHTCGINTAGAAYCWGKDEHGQLGSSAPNDECVFVEVWAYEQPFPCALTPRAVDGGLTFKQIGAGEDFTCGLTTGGAAYCWGRNWAGSIGDGTTTDRAAPVPVLGGHTFARLNVGRLHVCGVTTGGTVYCWGTNLRGQLGIGTIGGMRTTPQAVPGSYTRVTAGRFHTCALDAQGRAWCWGENENQQLGDGTTTDRPSPTLSTSPHTFVDLGAGADLTCGRRADGAVFCGLLSTRPVGAP